MAYDAPKYYTQEEAKVQLHALTQVDWARLNLLAKIQAHGVPDQSPEDFLQEALMRVLDGSRQWPTDLSPGRFLAQVMRSLVSAYWKKKVRQLQHQEVVLEAEIESADFESDDERSDAIEQHPDKEMTPDIALFVSDSKARFMRGLDDLAREVIEWQIEGCTKAEIMEALDLNDTAYDTVSRRIRRSLAKLTKDEVVK